MRQKLAILSLALLALAAGAIFSSGTGTALAASSHNDTLQGPRVAEYPGVDYVSVASQQCLSDGTVQINLSWQTYNMGYQWIDLSLTNNGFAQGTFVGIGPVAPNVNTQPWSGLLPGLTHYLRVNTLTPYGWYPSQTISFFTRNDCYYYQPPPPPVLDRDGDGVPDSQDYCPNQYGPAAYGGCPAPQGPGYPGNPGYPGYPGGSIGNMCAAGWCPGQPAPAQFCPATPQILIYPPPPGGCVWVTKGANASYYVGEQVTICWWVNQPLSIRIETQRPNGTTSVIPQIGDDGKGGCTNTDANGTALITGQPTGLRTTRLYGPTGQTLSTITWYVQ